MQILSIEDGTVSCCFVLIFQLNKDRKELIELLEEVSTEHFNKTNSGPNII